MLYMRILLLMAVSLYTSRVVLQVLGVEDYGIYSVVGGVVAMFTILSGSLSAAITRFLAFELGVGNKVRLKSVFSTSVNIQLLMALLLVVVIEIIGIWFLNNKMDVPPHRLQAATWVLHISMLTFIINLISVPYNAAIVAHEKMSAFAYVSLVDAFLRLGVVFLVPLLAGDKLILYALLLLIVSLIVRMIYGIYCSRRFEECKYSLHIDKSLFKEMLTFSGWNFIGSTSAVLRDQGVNIVLNIFCGPVVNAARGIAMQVNTAVYSFSSNFIMAMNPQITKSYATGNHSYLMQLIFRGSRYGFYILWLFALPILLETNQLLSIWLHEVPPYLVNFVRLVLLYSLIESFSMPLITAMLATGNIKWYQIVVGGVQLLNLPISYLLLHLGYPPESTFIVAIVLSVCCFFARLYMLRGMIQLPVRQFFRKVISNAIVVCALSLLIPLALHLSLLPSIWSTIIVLAASPSCLLLVIYAVGLDKEEHRFVNNKIREIRKKPQR